MTFDRNPLHCVIPPYLLERIVNKGTDDQRAAALKTIQQSNHLRLRREALVGMGTGLHHGTVAMGAEAHSSVRVRKVYDARGTESLPGTLVRSEGDGPSAEAAVDEAYDGAGETWDFYDEVYSRNSIDGNGMVITSTLHYGQRYNNAFWDGQQMVYGDGDGQIFDRFTIDLDVIGHELTHGVVQSEANLRYWYQSGALNESFADIFGTLIKQRSLGQDVKAADWLVGANIVIGKGYALRSLKAPGTAFKGHPLLGDDPQPGSMKGYVDAPAWDDNGGVHTNSGIPNHAFYVAAIGIGGNAWEKAGLIWYRTLCDQLKVDSNFLDTSQATVLVARQEFGKGSLEEQAVSAAWREVQVL